MLYITHNVSISEAELEFSAIRSQGSGGQNVNKVSTAIHLRFDFENSNLPVHCKNALRVYKDQRISSTGVIVIKAQQFRTQEKNRADALQRLQELIKKATTQPAKRLPTRPTKASKTRRLDSKNARSKIKSNRKKVDY